MPTFKYKAWGNLDDPKKAIVQTIEADDKEDAIKKLDFNYGVERDKSGKQTNGDKITVELQ